MDRAHPEGSAGRSQTQISTLSFPVLLAALAVWAAVLGFNPRRVADFHIYRTAAARFVAGASLYPLTDGAMPFKYAPAAAWLFSPWLLLPPRMAGLVWNIGVVAALALTARLFNRMLEREGRPPASPAVLSVAVLSLAQPLFLELFYGQVDLWMGVLLLIAALQDEKRSWLSGLLWAVAVLLKPTAVVMGLFFVLRRRWSVFGFAMVMGVLLFAPLLLRYGLSGMQEQTYAWAQTLARTTPPWVLGYNPQGLPTVVLSAFYPPNAMPPNRLLSVVDAAVTLSFVAVTAVLRPRGAALWAVLCFGAALVSPLAWRANFVLAYPMLVLLLLERDLRYARWGAACVGLIAATGLLVHDGLLSRPLFERVMLLRPFGLVAFACVSTLLMAERSRRKETLTASPGMSRLPGRRL